MLDLAAQTCVPCRGGVPPLTVSEQKELLGQTPGWTVVDEHHLRREYAFPDFSSGLKFVNLIGAVAETQGHHPDIVLAWGRVEVTMWTHKIDGLTQSDFIMAAKIDELQAGQ